MTLDELAAKRPVGSRIGWAIDDWTGRGIVHGYTLNRASGKPELLVLSERQIMPFGLDPFYVTWCKPSRKEQE